MKNTEKIIANIIRNHPGMTFIFVFVWLIVVGSTAFHFTEWRSRFNSFYYAFILMTTVGFGDFVPVTVLGRIITIFYGFIGIPMFVV